MPTFGIFFYTRLSIAFCLIVGSDDDGCQLAVDLNRKRRVQFDTYSQARAHLVQVHQINAAVEGENGNDDLADQVS